MKRLLLLSFIIITSTSAGEKPLLSFSPEYIEVGINEKTTVEVWIDSIEALKGFSVQLSYNSEKVNISEVREGTMFISPVFFASFIDSVAGIVKVESAMLGDGRKVDGSGKLFSFDVYGKSEGIDTLTFVAVSFRDVDLVRLEVNMKYGVLTVGKPSNVDFQYIKNNTFRLFQNYPNPFNPFTNIYFYLPQTSIVSIMVFNTTGQRVRLPVHNTIYRPGYHSVGFDATGLASGIYIFRLEARSSDEMTVFDDSRRMIFLR